MKSKDLQPKLPYPAKPACRKEGHIKSFPDKKKLMESITTKPLLQEMLKGLLEDGRKVGGMDEKGEGIKKYKQLQNSHMDVKYSIGNIVNILITLYGVRWVLDLSGCNLVSYTVTGHWVVPLTLM